MRLACLSPILLFTFCCQDASAFLNYKEGWNAALVDRYAGDCTRAMMESTRREFESAAAAAGDTTTRFPADVALPAFRGMCACLGQHIATTITMPHWRGRELELGTPIVREAMGGGRCRPEGPFGETMKRYWTRHVTEENRGPPITEFFRNPEAGPGSGDAGNRTGR